MLGKLLDRRFLTVTGKGGTGKTTVTAALALLAASRGKRVLVALSHTKERLSSMLETTFIDQSIQNILGSIDAVNLDPETCIEEYGMMVLRSKALYKVVIDNRIVKGFLRAVPGMDAWSMLGKALFHLKEQQDGRPRYDLVILDAPATGHGVQMLRVPQVISEIAPPGLLQREAQEGLALMRDPSVSGVVLVALAEEMPAAETEELHVQIRDGLKLPVAGLVINQVLTPLFSNRYNDLPAAAKALEEIPAFAPLATSLRTRSSREQIQHRMLERLSKISAPRAVLPALAVEQLRRKEIDALAKLLAQAGA